MRRFFGLKIVVLLAVLTFGCIDAINLTLEDETEFLVVNGAFSANQSRHRIDLYFATGQRVQARRPVTDASIRLLEDGVLYGMYTEVNDGLYELTTPVVPPVPGRQYQLDIQLPNGQQYASRPEAMPRQITGDSVFFDFTFFPEITPVGAINRPQAEVFVATPLPNDDEAFWLKWEVTTMYSFPEVQCSPFVPAKTCYVPVEEPQQTINLLDGSNLNSDYLPKWKVWNKVIPAQDLEFRGKHYFLVNQQSISREAHEYWRKVNLVANQTGSIFDAPPAAVRGNLFNINNPEEEVLGYFEVSNTDSLRGFITEFDLQGFYRFTDNACQDSANPFAQNGRFCCFCILLENATLDRPPWW